LPYCLVSQTSLWNKGAQIVKTPGKKFEVRVEDKKLFDGVIKNRLTFPIWNKKEKSVKLASKNTSKWATQEAKKNVNHAN
jgi:hypothetical protein